MAHALTAVRLILAAPVALAFARPALVDPRVLTALLLVAIATDYGDGRVARVTRTASPGGQLFDHGTDCVFVTAVHWRAPQWPALVTPLLPRLDRQLRLASTWWTPICWHRQKQLRMSVIGRWNGVLYFVPLVVLSACRGWGCPANAASLLDADGGCAWLRAGGVDYGVHYRPGVREPGRRLARHHSAGALASEAPLGRRAG